MWARAALAALKRGDYRWRRQAGAILWKWFVNVAFFICAIMVFTGDNLSAQAISRLVSNDWRNFHAELSNPLLFRDSIQIFNLTKDINRQLPVTPIFDIINSRVTTDIWYRGFWPKHPLPRRVVFRKIEYSILVRIASASEHYDCLSIAIVDPVSQNVHYLGRSNLIGKNDGCRKSHVGALKFESSFKSFISFFKCFPLKPSNHHNHYCSSRSNDTVYRFEKANNTTEPSKEQLRYGFGPLKHTAPFWVGVSIAVVGGVLAFAGMSGESLVLFLIGGTLFFVGMYIESTSPDRRSEDVRVPPVVIAELQFGTIEAIKYPPA